MNEGRNTASLDVTGELSNFVPVLLKERRTLRSPHHCLSLPAELYFVVARFLEESPCQEAAKVLQKWLFGASRFPPFLFGVV